MSFRDDERAQTVQVGAILLLGTLVVALSVYQVTSVPGQNRNVEFDHNQEVQSQLQGVRNAILETAATGEGHSASMSLGTQYSNRVFAVNPAPPSETIKTTDLGTVTIENAVVAGDPETRDFWDGEDRNYPSTALTYEPNYNDTARLRRPSMNTPYWRTDSIEPTELICCYRIRRSSTAGTSPS